MARLIDYERDGEALRSFLNERDRRRLELYRAAVAEGDAVVLVTDDSGQAAGWAVLHLAYRDDLEWQEDGESRRFQTDGAAYLEYMEVEESRRNRGLGGALLAAAAILAVLLVLPLVYRLAMKRGKASIYSGAMLLGSLTFPLLFFMGLIPGVHPLLQSLLFMAAAGIAITGVFAFPNAIMADIIDYDALRTGMRREALYYGAQNTIEKGVGSLAVVILAGLFLLGETAANPLGIRLIGPVAGAAAFIGFFIFRGYRLPDEVTAETVHIESRSL